MNPVTAAVLKAGVVSPDMLREMKRFSPVIDVDAKTGEPLELEMAARVVEEALASEQYVLVRETDLEVVQQYVATACAGTLHLEFDAEQAADIDITYGKTKLGEYIIAWRSDSVHDVMTNGLTYLVEDGRRVFFRDIRELFFGENKAFMVCARSTVEDHGNVG